MKIIITKIDRKQNIVYASFECSHGYGKGVWCNKEAEIGETTYVEFDIEEPQAIIKCSTEKKYSMKIANEVTFLTGDIIDIQDEIICLRFAETIIQIDHGFETIEVGEWVTVSVKPENLLIYSANL